MRAVDCFLQLVISLGKKETMPSKARQNFFSKIYCLGMKNGYSERIFFTARGAMVPLPPPPNPLVLPVPAVVIPPLFLNVNVIRSIPLRKSETRQNSEWRLNNSTGNFY